MWEEEVERKKYGTFNSNSIKTNEQLNTLKILLEISLSANCDLDNIPYILSPVILYSKLPYFF